MLVPKHFVTAFLILSLFINLSAAQVARVWLQTKGTNEVVLTLSPTVPEVDYEVFARSNGVGSHWSVVAQVLGGAETVTKVILPLSHFPPSIIRTYTYWRLIAAPATDSDGDGLSDAYEQLVSRTDPCAGDTGGTGVPDGYTDPDGDNWLNLDEVRNQTDPLQWNAPPRPNNLIVKTSTNGTTTVIWKNYGGVAPDYFIVERAQRTVKPPMNTSGRPRDPRILKMQEPTFIEGPYEFAARVSPQLDKFESYQYTETNKETLFPPAYRVQAHYSPKLRAIPKRTDGDGISQTIRTVQSQPNNDGFDLVIRGLHGGASYLVLVRDEQDRQWRASGYVLNLTNDGPVVLHCDAVGSIATRDQKPIAIPLVKFTPRLGNPEFTCGSGEDSDGDGLPDIYEVLVTKTSPNNLDAGNTGFPDGFRDLDHDGFSNLEEFRRRTDPLVKHSAPKPAMLKGPTMFEAMQALTPQSDLAFEPKVYWRRRGHEEFLKLEQPVWTMFPQGPDRRTAHGDFDLLIQWQIGKLPCVQNLF